MRNFRRIIIIALVGLIGCASASAQIRFGVKAGMNFNKLDVKNLPSTLDSDNKCGFTAGVMTEIGIPLGGLAVDLSFMYSHMSAQTESINKEEIETAKDFLNIPIHLKYKFGLPVVNNLLSPMIFTGPSFAFKFGDENDIIRTESIQYSWDFGVGIEVIKHLQIQAGYSLGLNNILKKTDLVHNATDDIKLKNNCWTITLAYLF